MTILDGSARQSATGGLTKVPAPNRQKLSLLQGAPAAGDGCDDLSYWFSDAVLHPKPPKVPPKPKPAMTMSALPAACRAVLKAP